MKTSTVVFLPPGALFVFVCALFCLAGNYHARAQADLVGHWKFDATSGSFAADSTANANHGLLVNGPVWVSGQLSNALSFDGANDYVEVTNSASLGITADITLTAWIKRGVLGNYGGIVAKTDGVNIWDYDLYFDGGANNLHFWSDSQSPQDAVSAGVVADLEWHHVAATREGETVTFYIDGSPAGTVTVSGQSADNPIPVRIGTDGPSYSVFSMFTGLIDDVRIYSRALSAKEIGTLYPPATFSITQQPADVTQALAYSATFAVRAEPAFGLAYQWYKAGAAIPGAAGATYTTGPLTAADNATQYYVIITNFSALSVTSRVATLTVVPQVFSPGFMKREVFRDITGTLVADLTASPNYPTAPDETTLVVGFEAPTGVGNNYGQRLSGFITPSETGNYLFFIASDDNGQLWLSPDEDSAKKELIATEPGWNPVRDWIGTARRDPDVPENRSAPIALVAGRRYYVEALQKEGAGGDNLGVTVIKEGDPLLASGSAPAQGSFIGASGPPATATVTFTNQPQSVATTVGQTATFTAQAGSESSPIVYQWQKNGVAIFRANASTHTTPALVAGDASAQFRAIAYIPGGSVTSAVATVTLSSDVTPPAVEQAGALGDPLTGQASSVIIRFNEPVDQASATNLANYSINGGAIAISGAVLQPDLRSVRLSTAALSPGAAYTLTIRNVVDRSPIRNAMSEVTRSFQVSNLVLHLAFDDGTQPALDSSAFGNHGAFVDQPQIVPGQIGSALSFDGVNDYVDIPNNPVLGITGDLTIATWVKRAALLNYGGLVAKTDGANVWDYDFYFAGGANTLYFYSDTQTPQNAISTGEVADQEWHHVAVTRQGETVTFYIDGAPAGTVSVTGQLADNPHPVRTGTDGPAYDPASMFSGQMDDVRIYNRALSADEMQQFRVVAPRLSVARSDGNVIFTWPATPDLVLETTSVLVPSSWTRVNAAPSTVGNQKTLSVAITGNSAFYRLRSP